MKIIVIGDIHGRDDWRVINPNDYDLIIFIGDYVDSWDVSDLNIINNLLDIIAFKTKYYDKVVLLLGNHDTQYMFIQMGRSTDIWRVSGFRASYANRLFDIFTTNKEYFQMSYELKTKELPYLFTHAGVTNQWYKRHEQLFKDFRDKWNGVIDNLELLSIVLNSILLTSNSDIFTEIGHGRGGLRGDYGSPLWADRQETRFGFLKGYHHVVGHTPIEKIETHIGQLPGSITYIDVLHLGRNKGVFYKIEI